MELLAQFLLRLAFGLAIGMAITLPRLVSSGFFRNHLYVTLGLTTLAALVSYAVSPEAFWYAAGAALASYVGSVCWLYENKNIGRAVLIIVALLSLAASTELITGYFDANSAGAAYWDRYLPVVSDDITSAEASNLESESRRLGLSSGVLMVISTVSSGLLMGLTLAAMLLGHWYLNSPGMELAPLRRLLMALGGAIVLQAVVSAVALAGEVKFAGEFPAQLTFFLLLRWLFELVGVAVLAVMAWQTLKIPNTQSATGILFVAVIAAFIGESTGLLLSADSAFPL